MTGEAWQTTIALACVAAAAGLLGRRLYLFLTTAGRGCTRGCGSACPSKDASRSLVSLDVPPASQRPNS